MSPTDSNVQNAQQSQLKVCPNKVRASRGHQISSLNAAKQGKISDTSRAGSSGV